MDRDGERYADGLSGPSEDLDVMVLRLLSAAEMPFLKLKGNDVWEYYGSLSEIRDTVAAHNPACVEVQLKAMTNHAGATPGWPTDPKVMSMDEGMVVEKSSYDPVFVLEQALSQQTIAEMYREIANPGREQIAEWALT